MANVKPYQTWVYLAADLCGMDWENLSTANNKTLQRYLSENLDDAESAAWWPDLCRIENRAFRLAWDSTDATYVAGDEVWYDLTRKYYRALRAVPVGTAPSDDAGNTTEAYWAECFTSYVASNYVATTAYAVGDQVYYPLTDKVYACHTASTGNAPTNTSYWGELAAFKRTLPFDQDGQTEIGDVCRVMQADPRIKPFWPEEDFFLNSDGVNVPFCANKIWVEFRVKTPVLKGDSYDATATYAVGDQMLWTDGDLYDCVTATNAGETPVTHAAKWSLVYLPPSLRQAVCLAAAADFQATRNEKDAARLDKMAGEMLDKELDKLLRQQGQMRRTNFRR